MTVEKESTGITDYTTDLTPWESTLDPRQALHRSDPELYAAIEAERKRQHDGLEMIASENYVSPAVLAAMGSVLTNKYAEGYPGHRYYGGCEYVDIVEDLAIERAKQLFGADHANVQPHSGAQANVAAYLALIKTGRYGAGAEAGPRRPPDARGGVQLLRQAVSTSSTTAFTRDGAHRLRRPG